MLAQRTSLLEQFHWARNSARSQGYRSWRGNLDYVRQYLH